MVKTNPKLSRFDDPFTSTIAGEMVDEARSTRVVLAVFRAEQRDMTDEELYDAYMDHTKAMYSYDYSRIRHGRKNLADKEVLKNAGYTRESKRGRQMQVWVLA